MWRSPVETKLVRPEDSHDNYVVFKKCSQYVNTVVRCGSDEGSLIILDSIGPVTRLA